MQYRDYKQFFEGGVYHIYSRGHNKMAVFRDTEDYKFFLQRLAEILSLKPSKSRWLRPLPKGSFTILCYCLMPNHFHFIIQQETKLPVSKIIGKLLTSYGIYFNKKYQQVGTIFQDRFMSKEINNDEYLVPLSAYIHKNHAKFLSWRFSSLDDYIKGDKELIVDSTLILSMFNKDRHRYYKYIKSYNKTKEDLITDLKFDE